MAGITNALLLDDDFMELYKQMLANQRWQQQLASGANIANTGWKTALGLAIGSGLGNWLGYKFGNYQRANDDARQYGMNNPAVRAAVNNILGGEADLGWKPQYQLNRALPVNNFLPPLQQKPPPQAEVYVDKPFQQPVVAGATQPTTSNPYTFNVSPIVPKYNPNRWRNSNVLPITGF